MHVRRLSLIDFRSYAEVDLSLEPGITTFLGPNGQGKTNLVEALGYVATLGSHRVATDAPLVRAGAPRAIVRVQVQRAGRATLIEIEINPGKANRARVNRGPVPRPREVLGALRTVSFAPEDLVLVKGDPGERRRFLDDLLVQRTPRLAGVRADLDRVLRQRNALLRSASAARRGNEGAVVATLEVWDEQLAALSAQLVVARLDLLQRLQPYLRQGYAALSGADVPASAAYACAWAPDLPDPADLRDDPQPLPTPAVVHAALLAAVAARRRDELDRGVTLVGPQRDEMPLALGELPVKGYASHGESWTYALALRWASYALLRADATGDGEPVLVLDDVFAELDTDRRSRLAGLVADAEQVLVTAAVAADVPDVLRGDRVEVANGKVRRAD